MQPSIVLSIPEQVALVIAFVAAARVRVPAINGWWVLVLSFFAAMMAASTQVSWDSIASLRPVLQSGLMVFLYAVGTVSTVQAASKPVLDAIAVRRTMPGTTAPTEALAPTATGQGSATGVAEDGK